MKITALCSFNNGKPTVWNVGIDIPNGIRSAQEYMRRVKQSSQHPNELSFHVHSDGTLSEVIETLTELLNIDRQHQYRYLPVHMVYSIDNVYVTGSAIFELLRLHFQAKRQSLGIIEDAWLDEEPHYQDDTP